MVFIQNSEILKHPPTPPHLIHPPTPAHIKNRIKKNYLNIQTITKNPTHMIKQALKITKELFFHPRCNENCQEPCQNNHPPRTLNTIICYIEHNIEPLNSEILKHPPTPSHLIRPPTLAHIKNNPIRYPIYSIIDHYIKLTKDIYKLIKKTHTYLCHW